MLTGGGADGRISPVTSTLNAEALSVDRTKEEIEDAGNSFDGETAKETSRR